MKKIIFIGLTSLFLFSTVQAETQQEMLNKGNTLWAEGKITEAEAQFKKIVKINPDSSMAHARLANLYLTQNKSTKAIDEYQTAIMANPEDAILFVGIAIAYLHGQHYEMADAMVKQAIELDPDMENAGKLKKYIDAKTTLLNSGEMPQDTTHNAGSMQNPHSEKTSTAPAAVQNSLQKSH